MKQRMLSIRFLIITLLLSNIGTQLNAQYLGGNLFWDRDTIYSISLDKGQYHMDRKANGPTTYNHLEIKTEIGSFPMDENTPPTLTEVAQKVFSKKFSKATKVIESKTGMAKTMCGDEYAYIFNIEQDAYNYVRYLAVHKKDSSYIYIAHTYYKQSSSDKVEAQLFDTFCWGYQVLDGPNKDFTMPIPPNYTVVKQTETSIELEAKLPNEPSAHLNISLIPDSDPIVSAPRDNMWENKKWEKYLKKDMGKIEYWDYLAKKDIKKALTSCYAVHVVNSKTGMLRREYKYVMKVNNKLYMIQFYIDYSLSQKNWNSDSYPLTFDKALTYYKTGYNVGMENWFEFSLRHIKINPPK